MKLSDTVADIVSVIGLAENSNLNYIGPRRLAESLGWGMYRATRILRLMNRYLLVFRAQDPRGRRRYRAYRLNPAAPRDVEGLARWLRDFGELRQVREGLVPGYMVLDAVLDEYYVTGTSALCMAGECWNLVGIPSLMVAVSPREEEEARRLAGRLAEASGTDYYVVVKDLSRCEYGFDESLGVNLASPVQALVDALANRGRPGVDYYETLTTFAGNYLLDWALDPGQPALRRLRRLAEEQYPGRLGEILSPLWYMYMLLLSLHSEPGDEYSRAFAQAMKTLTPPRLEEYDTIIYQAMRGSLLGNKVAAYLGLEPLVTKNPR